MTYAQRGSASTSPDDSDLDMIGHAPNRKGIRIMEGFDWLVNAILICDWPHLLTYFEMESYDWLRTFNNNF